MDYLNKHINEIPNILKPYIAMIFEKYVGVDSAINIIEPIVDYHYFDIRAFIYFNLLRKEQRYGTKLYDFCEKVRKMEAKQKKLYSVNSRWQKNWKILARLLK